MVIGIAIRLYLLRDSSLICCMNNATKALEESVKAYTQRLCGIENH